MSDAYFGPAYIDVDEARELPLPHRYVHGGFEGTDTRFSFYFPPPEQWQGRFMHMLEGGMGGNENSLVSGMMHDISIGHPSFHLAFLELGAYLVESNQGHLGNDMSGVYVEGEEGILEHRASAAAARFSREVAAEHYGSPPHHGYVWGGSGGGHRSVACFEQHPDLYDGAVPYIISPHSGDYLLAYAGAMEELPDDAISAIIDACEPGGSGDPFAGLTHTQREALALLYRGGYPRGAESQMRRELIFGFILTNLQQSDPTYFDDFWTKRGYLGADAPEQLEGRIIKVKATVTRAIPAGEVLDQMARFLSNSPDAVVGIEVDMEELEPLFYAKARVLSGAAAGRELYIGGVTGRQLTPFPIGSPELFNGVEPGDEIEFDNADYVAFSYAYLYTGTNREKQFLGVDGHDVYPVRPDRVPGVRPEGGVFTGRFEGRMIFCNGALDVNVGIPNSYPRLVQEHFGDRTDDHFRMWWMDNASHTPPEFHRPGPAFQTRLVSYTGLIDQALRDLVAWVEGGVAPARQHWQFTSSNTLSLPAGAEERGGIQPVAHVLVNGALRAEIRAGDPVTLSATAVVPEGAGSIVQAEWDFDESATWPRSHPDLADGTSSRIEVSVTYTYDRPGTYFPCFRVASHRNGSDGTGTPIFNLARARVVVSA